MHLHAIHRPGVHVCLMIHNDAIKMALFIWYACGLCSLCLHYNEPWGFSTFFSVSVATHETACDSSNKLTIIVAIMEHLLCKSKSSAKRSIPMPSRMSACSEKEFTLPLPGAIFMWWCFNRKSQDCHVTYKGSLEQLHRVLQQECCVGLK